MGGKGTKSGSDLFIVDNSDEDWKVLHYLHEWCQLSERMDIATGFFEIGSLLALDGEWQKVDQIRILMGDEVSLRTKKAFEDGLQRITRRLDGSLESEKEANDFLRGVPAIVEAIASGKILCRVYRKDKFHAKAYITRARQAVIGSIGLVGSSNFTLPGLTINVELNVQLAGRQVNPLQEWYEQHWAEAEDVTPEILRTVERHVLDYPPFEIYAKSLQEFFRGHETTADEWEAGDSRMYPRLDQYQKEGYHNVLKIARKYNGAFLCDGVGLGKTFIGLMLIERLVMHDRKRVALFVPKATRQDVWEPHLRNYLPHVSGPYSNLLVFNHTDIGREGEFPYQFQRVKEMADVIIIDEAHHFRNPGIEGIRAKGQPSRYRRLYDLIEGPNGVKQVFLLTATPINNRLHDFRHELELLTRKEEDYFGSTVGIRSVRGHFVSLERELDRIVEAGEQNGGIGETNMAEAEELLRADDLFQALVVQRSRAYVRESQIQEGGSVTSFPTREPPKVVDYSLKKTYSRLLQMLESAFEKEEPLFFLGIYYPLAYYRGPDDSIDPLEENRQKQVVALIRTLFLKRFESSVFAFESSCNKLLLKILAWVTKHSQTDMEKRRLDRWKRQHADLIGYVHERQLELWGAEQDEDADEDIISEEMLDDVEEVSRVEYRVEDILSDSLLDLDQIAEFLDETRKFKPAHDDKLKALARLLKTDSVLKQHKALIFTEFADTARYLASQLKEAEIEGVAQIDSHTKGDRSRILRRFSPYYNGSSTGDLQTEGLDEIRILISTDVLSEGLNLQDATRLINYDLHWNPVRLMQRIGRVDRRLNPEIEKTIVQDHPEQAELRGKVVYWNFLPPDELEDLLRLYQRVSKKTLRISKTLGIEGRKLLKPEDDYEALREFNEKYEGKPSLVEEMHLELKNLLKTDPGLEQRLNALPGRVFSGQEHPSKGARAVFLCYRFPLPDHSAKAEDGNYPWTEEAGETKWYLFDLAGSRILEEPSDIINLIRCKPGTPRHCALEGQTLSEIRAKVEKHIKNTYMKRVQAPVGVKPILKCWMELS